MKVVITLGKNVSASLGMTTSVIDAGIQKKIYGSGSPFLLLRQQ